MTKTRVSLCLKAGTEILRLAWFNEDANGIYLGEYGETGDAHLSYHKNGRCHYRRRDKFCYLPSQTTPIEDIRDAKQLCGLGIPLRSRSVQTIVKEFEGDKDAFNVFIFALAEYREFDHLNVSSFIIPKESEAGWIMMRLPVFSWPSMADTRPLGMVVFPLAYFRNHKLVIIVSVFRGAVHSDQ